MKSWQEDLLDITDSPDCEHTVFGKIEIAVKALGFENCGYGMRAPFPASNPKTIILNNYPAAWQERYANQNYLKIDPTVRYASRTQTPLIWDEKVFISTPGLWSEAQSFGLKVGWAQSNLSPVGVGGMLTLSRSDEILTQSELLNKENKLRWLVAISHLCLSRVFMGKLAHQVQSPLTKREVEVLKWTADGKTSGEISDILGVSGNTVNFHIKNSIEKLQTSNKTAAVVRAVMLGLLC